MEIISHSADETRAIGAALAAAIFELKFDRPVVVALNGELGAGKTTFVHGFLRALGVEGAIRSPTYTLIEPYELDMRTIYHLDLYRLNDWRELEMLAPRDMLNRDSILLIEWAERGGRALPTADLTLTLRYFVDGSSSERAVALSGGTTAGNELARRLHGPADEASVCL